MSGFFHTEHMPFSGFVRALVCVRAIPFGGQLCPSLLFTDEVEFC